jgi:hypothetical protein
LREGVPADGDESFFVVGIIIGNGNRRIVVKNADGVSEMNTCFR